MDEAMLLFLLQRTNLEGGERKSFLQQCNTFVSDKYCANLRFYFHAIAKEARGKTAFEILKNDFVFSHEYKIFNVSLCYCK